MLSTIFFFIIIISAVAFIALVLPKPKPNYKNYGYQNSGRFRHYK